MAALRRPKVGLALSVVVVLASLSWAATTGTPRIVSIVVCLAGLSLSLASTLVAGTPRERRGELLSLLALGVAVALVFLTGSVIPIAVWFVMSVAFDR